MNEPRFVPVFFGGPFDGARLPPQPGTPPASYVFSSGDLEAWRALDEPPATAPVYGDAYAMSGHGKEAGEVTYDYVQPD